jgi:hypothetical protein
VQEKHSMQAERNRICTQVRRLMKITRIERVYKEKIDQRTSPPTLCKNTKEKRTLHYSNLEYPKSQIRSHHDTLLLLLMLRHPHLLESLWSRFCRFRCTRSTGFRRARPCRRPRRSSHSCNTTATSRTSTRTRSSRCSRIYPGWWTPKIRITV